MTRSEICGALKSLYISLYGEMRDNERQVLEELILMYTVNRVEPEEETRKRVGTRIYYERRRMDITRAELAKRVGMSVASLYRYEKGEREIRADDLQKIANALEIDVACFF